MRLLGLGVVSLCAIAQSLRVATAKEEVIAPRFKAEPQYRIGDAPVNLYRDVVSGDATLRARALGNLFARPDTDYMMPNPPDITLRSVNLDDDPEPENILIIHMPYGPTIVFVADKKNDGWYIVGRFHYW